MRKQIFTLIAASLALASAMNARADSIVFTGFAHGSEDVNYAITGANPTSGAASAGGFATLDGAQSFESYCVDLYQHIAFNDAPYTEYTAPGTSHVFANSRAYADLGRLYATAGVVSDAVSEAAFQIAVWEIAYETTPGAYSLSSGVATFTGGSADSSGALTLASSWLASLSTGAHPGIEVLESSAHQDVIAVPEPETYALFLAGLGAVGFVARRRKG